MPVPFDKGLISLKDCDEEIFRIEEEKDSRPEILKDKKMKIQEAKKKLSSIEQEIKELAKAVDQKELDLKSNEEKITKLNTQLNTAKSNEEYSVLTKEINELAQANSSIEDGCLRNLTKIDSLKDRLNQAKSAIEAQTLEFNKLKDKINNEIKELNKKLETQKARRSDITRGINKDALSVYERIRKSLPKDPIVAVRGNSCQGCFMEVTTQQINLLRRKKDLVQCHSCIRILFLED